MRVADTNGTPVEVIVGLVRSNVDGRWRRGLAIGAGPSATFTVPEATNLIRALEQSNEDLQRVEGTR
ncbi:hypothetical protein ACFWIW_10590 [Amycolatopsis sp. NPDC058340]|uniref:hypothetical protein n=1 Tax=Amycolatopsis sp. NPDC058340 TaxID=3346453 RepID=UPI0036523A8F